MKDILLFFSIFTSKQKKYFLLLLLLMLIGAVLESVGIAAILPLISLMGQPDFIVVNNYAALVADTLHVTTHKEFIIACAVLLIVFYVIKNAFIAWEIYIQRMFTMKMQTMFAKEILTTYLAKPYTFHVNHNSAKLLRDANSGASNICNNILMSLLYLGSEIITATAIWIMLIYVDAFTAIVVAFIMGMIIYSIIRIFRGKIFKQGNIQNIASVEYLKWINQALGGIKETKILGKEHYFLAEFVSSYTNYAKACQIYSFLSDVPRIIIEMVVVAGLLFLIIIKLAIGDNAGDIIPVLGVLAMAAFRLMPSANRIVGFYNSIKSQMPLFCELYGVLVEIKIRLANEIEALPLHDDEKISFQHKLHINNISFGYDESKDLILEGVSFDIYKGKFVGIVGPSGAGKTTFVDILLGLLQPTEGNILCDDKDIQDNIRGWQANLAYVPQDIYLLDGSIRENIALGESADSIDDELINKVLEMAELYEYVVTLPEGVDTFVGERGVKLSGGQRQRIGIARALYQQPEVLILDEATSALDNETEKAITDTILKFKGKITIIAIAHRISTLEACDYKIKLENSKAEIIY